MVTLKSKYIVENQTGMMIECKQRGTPDLDPREAPVTTADPLGRSVRRLLTGERVAVHWDDADLDRMLVMRPMEGKECTRCAEVGNAVPLTLCRLINLSRCRGQH